MSSTTYIAQLLVIVMVKPTSQVKNPHVKAVQPARLSSFLISLPLT